MKMTKNTALALKAAERIKLGNTGEGFSIVPGIG